ncbi:hypothetical protein OXPF_39320 [Oxobacter pfennigii]|uniref:Phage P2 GpU n=1 Tax=Oxobacter pfennigii TaxID=36849 RepID=A0A0P8WV76_9CLOT|nr:phage tail protein [Oxobacter pfennigii]KPU42153.1 hypothetical protein OXPF_39320 [Oxobacter pfennigii]
MPIASFANKTFQTDTEKIYTFGDYQYNSNFQTEKQDAQGVKPSTYNKGPDLDNMSFKIVLDAELGINPRREWEEWRQIMHQGIPYPFILGNKPLSENKFLLINIGKSNVRIDNYGNILYMELNLQFDEYVRPGSQKSTSSAANSPGLANNILEMLDPELLGLLNKSSQKRTNTQMNLAMLNRVD